MYIIWNVLGPIVWIDLELKYITLLVFVTYLVKRFGTLVFQVCGWKEIKYTNVR